jgi:putative endonuclease
MYYVYMIKNSHDNLYIGMSRNPHERLLYHNNRVGSAFTMESESDFKIVFLEKYQYALDAQDRETQLKKWSRFKKEKLIELYSKGIPTKLKNV